MFLIGHASTPDKLQMVTDAAGTVDYHSSYADFDDPDTVTLGRKAATGVGAATTDIVDGAGAGITRKVKWVRIRNRHASQAVGVIIKETDGTTAPEIHEVTLQAQEALHYDEGRGWQPYDANGLPKTTSFSAASQADQEAGTSNSVATTPAVQHYHPSSVKAWLKCGLTANILASYNITSLADTGTGAVTVTIATDFSSVHWACTATIELTSTTLAQSCTYDSMAAGTIILRSVVEAGSAADPVSWSTQMCGDQ
jgi:hypothetical protein